MPPELFRDPVTLGDHLRRRRLELGLYQKDVAVRLGVTPSTIWNWEHGMDPEIRFIPRIIGFLGYVPFDCPEDTLGKLSWFKKVKGLSCEKLGELLGRGTEQLEDWLSGKVRPNRKNEEIIDTFLQEVLSSDQSARVQRCEVQARRRKRMKIQGVNKKVNNNVDI
jgi:transcriptional regulator with XRE-family HTH domain